MANHKSALKRNRQSLKRRALNNINKTKANNAVKKVRVAITKTAEEAAQSLKNAMTILHRAVTKGTLHKNTAARRISRLSRAVHKAHGDQTRPPAEAPKE
ncbi:MAG: 30S ribosomal protein S20 [Deltaproteobacteria bacterium]|nr:30S ribosomal protein S20 [Deltaproteobacteria bacterium]